MAKIEAPAILLDSELKIDTLCNRQERKLFKILRDAVKQFNGIKEAHPIIGIGSQVSLSSFVDNKKNFEVFEEYKSLYVDFVIFDIKTTYPLCIVEYFGDGHYKEDNKENRNENNATEIRDFKKQIIANKIGVDFMIIKYNELYTDNAEKAEKDLRIRFLNHFKSLQHKFYDENLKIKFAKEK